MELSCHLHLRMILKTFGKLPSGQALKKIEASQNYKNKNFQNLALTKVFTGESQMKIFRDFLSSKNSKPPKPLPSVKTNLKNLPDDKPVIIWFGHSSYLIKINGKHILVDPVF